MYFYNLILPVNTFILGVITGALAIIYRTDIKSEIDDADIQHVGYTPEQMGYDK